ncbi:MAG: inositol monophosphatase family protein, partial [Gemmatimonadaceae bacterium]
MTASMTGGALDARVAPAAELARLTGDIALRHYRSNLTVEIKADGSPVTAADRAAERAARDWVARFFPEDGILGEEFGEERSGARRRWVIDPIDGTKSFVRGTPLWGSLVALCEGEAVLAGAAYFPAVGELIAAAPGAGCWWNGSRCGVSVVDSLERATVLTTDERFQECPARRAGWERLASSAAVSRSWGDCFGYLLVATGRAEVMCDPIMSPWDSAALHPIIREAGGV